MVSTVVIKQEESLIIFPIHTIHKVGAGEAEGAMFTLVNHQGDISGGKWRIFTEL